MAAEWLELDLRDVGMKTIRYRLDINGAQFKGRAGMAWVIMACNTHLSLNELCAVMAAYGCHRTRSWVHRCRWVFADPAHARSPGGVTNVDGQDERAFRIMDEHPSVSARELSRILKKHGIERGKDWVLKNRVRPKLSGDACPI